MTITWDLLDFTSYNPKHNNFLDLWPGYDFPRFDHNPPSFRFHLTRCFFLILFYCRRNNNTKKIYGLSVLVGWNQKDLSLWSNRGELQPDHKIKKFMRWNQKDPRLWSNRGESGFESPWVDHHLRVFWFHLTHELFWFYGRVMTLLGNLRSVWFNLTGTGTCSWFYCIRLTDFFQLRFSFGRRRSHLGEPTSPIVPYTFPNSRCAS